MPSFLMRNPPNVVFLIVNMKMRRATIPFGYNLLHCFFILIMILSDSIDSLNFTTWDFSQFN